MFSSFKEDLPLFKDLPKAPTLGSLSFLVKQGSSDIRELFEDNWTTSCLTYAAAVEVYSRIAELQKEELFDEDDPLFAAVRRLILCAANSPARSLQFYRYLAEKRALRATPRPGTQRQEIISQEEAKSLNAKIDTAKKLSRSTGSQRGQRGRRGRGFGTYFGPRNPFFHYGYQGGYRGGRRGGPRGRRGRGRGRPGGRQ